MFRKREDTTLESIKQPTPAERINSVLGPGITWKGSLSGIGGIRIEGALEGDITIQGMLVVGESGRVTCERILASVVIIAGVVKGDITAEKIEIRSTGRVWGNVVTAAFATEEGAFLRGQIQMEEKIELGDVQTPSSNAISLENEPNIPERENSQ